jgi:uncharacterized spore protein YtfJ
MTSMTGITNAAEQDRRLASPAETLERTLSQALGSVRSDAVFGRPVEKGTTTVVPCAEVIVGMGLGGGRGAGQGASADQAGEGEGIGGGGGGRGRPVAVIVIREDGVTVQPVLDATRIALAALTTVGFMAFWVARLAAAGRGAKKGSASFGALARTLRG